MKICDAQSSAELLLSKNKILILIHANPDGDCIGSGAALASALLEAGKNVRLACPSDLPERLAFICENIPEDVLCFGKGKLSDFVPDFVVTADVASPELLGAYREEFSEKIDLCIDHHLINTINAKHMLRYSDAAACGEIILEVCDKISSLTGKAVLDEKIANMLYSAISSDTGSFKYGNTTAKTLLCATRLKSAGADSERISKLLFDTKSLSQFRLTACAINNTEFLYNGKLAYCLITEAELSACGASKEDLDGISQLFREVSGVELSIFAKQSTDAENGENRIKMSLRSNRDVNAAKICECFGGGGHIKAAGCSMAGNDNNRIKEEIIAKVCELYPEIFC